MKARRDPLQDAPEALYPEASPSRMSRVLLAIGSAHAGEPLTQEQLGERLRCPIFRALFNGSPPAVVKFESAEDAAFAVAFENARRRRS